eukprot:TRINITY_DN12095_c0_g6_i1.p1 TRINITY_DN12095_c0_g6~~TRINITY_DN12095_c0_g6_i1.p1  ORF type:complete len:433 (-),score=54.70 TRINITY_DN12095_c0_g6_i1:302-1600(-)
MIAEQFACVRQRAYRIRYKPFAHALMGDAPPCAMKIGPIKCFCLWSGGPSGEGRQEPCSFSIAPADPSMRIESTWRSDEPSDAAKSVQSAGVALGGDCGSASAAPSPGAMAAVTVVTPVSIGSREGVQVRNVNQVDHPLMAAVRLQSGSVPSVERELSFIDGQRISRGIDTGSHERLRRIVAQHSSAAQSAEWHVRENCLGSGGLEFGARVVDGMSQWFRCAEFRGCDVVKGFAALLEVDLCGAFSDDVFAAEPLGVHTAKRDAIWRVIGERSSSNGHGGIKQHESVWSYGALDALDEPVGALVVIAHTPLEHRFSASGAASHHRRSDATDFDCLIHCVEPLWPEKGEPASAAGFRLRQLGVSKLTNSSTVVAAEGTMPKHELFHAQLCKYLLFAKQLDQRMQMSPRSDLYARVRRHLQRIAPATRDEVQAA